MVMIGQSMENDSDDAGSSLSYDGIGVEVVLVEDDEGSQQPAFT